MWSLDEIVFDEEPHVYTFRSRAHHSVTQIIRAAGLGFDFSQVPPERLAYAQDRGRAVHQACHFYDEGDLDMSSVDPKIRGYVEGYVRFRAECSIKVIAVEKRLLSPFGCQTCTHKAEDHFGSSRSCVEARCQCVAYVAGLGIGGTPDLVCWMNGRRVIIDRKTSQIMDPAMGIQTAAYQELWTRARPAEPVTGRYGLRVEAAGKYKLIAHEDAEDRAAFLDSVEYVRRNTRMDKWRTKYTKRGRRTT